MIQIRGRPATCVHRIVLLPLAPVEVCAIACAKQVSERMQVIFMNRCVQVKQVLLIHVSSQVSFVRLRLP